MNVFEDSALKNGEENESSLLRKNEELLQRIQDDMYRNGHSTTDENHWPIRDNVNVFHVRVFFLFSCDCATNDLQKIIVGSSLTHLIPQRDLFGIE